MSYNLNKIMTNFIFYDNTIYVCIYVWIIADIIRACMLMKNLLKNSIKYLKKIGIR